MALEITESNFEEKVLQQSHTVPVLVDFWAPWCGPCLMLAPVLDKLHQEYGGRFVLAKVDTDDNQRVAGRYRISGIPDVKMFVNGEVAGQFTGAMPEPNLRKFLDKHIPDPESGALRELLEKSPKEAADLVLQERLEGAEAQDALWQGMVAELCNGADKTRLQELLRAQPEFGGKYSDSRGGLLAYLESESDAQGAKRLGGLFNPDTRRESLEYYLARVENASPEERPQAKEGLLACFYLLGSGDELVAEYRRKLSSLLY